MKTLDDEFHERWARMTDDGKLDNRVAELERACDDFFHQQRARHNPSDSAWDHFRLFRALAVADLKKRIVLRQLSAISRAHTEAQVGDGVYSGPKYW